MELQTSIAASVADTVQVCPPWVKNAAKATSLFLFLKGVVWLAAWWLAFRGL
jgi:hypothetical protein